MELCDKNKPDASTDLLIDAIRPGSAADDDSVLQVNCFKVHSQRVEEKDIGQSLQKFAHENVYLPILLNLRGGLQKGF